MDQKNDSQNREKAASAPDAASDHPNMLAAAWLAGLLGALMLALSIREKATSGDSSFESVLLGSALLVLAVCAYDVHRRLKAMTPEGRDAYWREFDRATEENHRRNVEMYVRRGRDGNGLG